MIQISIISMLILIIVLHIIFSNLMDWAFKKVSKTDEPIAAPVIFLMIAEAFLIVQLFEYYLI